MATGTFVSALRLEQSGEGNLIRSARDLENTEPTNSISKHLKI